MRLRDYQSRALDCVAEHIRAGRTRVCLVCPTGGGKTAMAAAWVASAPVVPTLWVAHRAELIAQAYETLSRVLPPASVGVIAPGWPATPAARVQVSTIQTLLARDARPPAGRIVLDECQHYPATQLWASVLGAYPDAPVLGLTATPERQDGRALGDVFNALVVAARYPDLVAAGHLVPCRAFAPAEAVATDGLARDPVDAYLEFGERAPAFLFAPRVQLAATYAEQFIAAGIPAVAVHERTPRLERVQALDDFRRGRVRVLASVAALTEGVDIPAARVCLIARRFAHEGNYLQAAGRVLRPAPGKADAILIDLVGAVLEHGLPTEDRVYSLDGEAIRRATPSLRQCPACGAVVPGSPEVCARCGYVYPVRPVPQPRIYSIALRAVYAGAATPADAKAAEWLRLRTLCLARAWSLDWAVREYGKLFAGELPDISDDDRRAVFAGLTRLAAERGFKPGFAAARFHALFGAWQPRAWRTERAA